MLQTSKIIYSHFLVTNATHHWALPDLNPVFHHLLSLSLDLVVLHIIYFKNSWRIWYLANVLLQANLNQQPHTYCIEHPMYQAVCFAPGTLGTSGCEQAGEPGAGG